MKMVTCEVCGSENFDKHEGFLYCSVCLTQSQTYYEQEYDFQHHDMSTARTLKPKIAKEKPDLPEDGSWTSWEVFNHILYGMTQEVKNCGAEGGFEVMVLKIWAAYLRACEVAFFSSSLEKLPKLGLNYKGRDARLLHRVDIPLNFLVKRKRIRSQSRASSAPTLSKRSLSLKRNKIIAADYQEHLSSSMDKGRSLANETLESLGDSSTEAESLGKTENDSESIAKSFKEIMKKEDYKVYKNSYKSARLLASAKATAERNIKCLGKNKLLSMIHLALLMIGSAIQLSDLLRFIREGHLSYAKVTHFLPAKVKLPKKDSVYIDVISDSYMPTHLRQRIITGQLGYLLKIKKIASPDIETLVDRYCSDLNLPDEVANLSKRIARHYWPSFATPRSKSPLPSFESWAMVSVIFIMKLLFGLNDKTEILFSYLARIANGAIKNREIFTFQDWQKYIECRKSILNKFHYPTQEQLNDSPFTSSKKFLQTLVMESKDDHRSNRFIPYSDYYMEQTLISIIKEKLQQLSKTQKPDLINFQPSLTPQTSHLETILNEPEENGKMEKLPLGFLKKTFKGCDVQVFVNPKKFLSELKENADMDDILVKNGIGEKDSDLLLKCSCNYWIVKYPSAESGRLVNFKEEVLEKTPRNFRWLLKECSRMLEMNMRDLYEDLLRLEEMLSGGTSKGKKRKQNGNK